MSVSTIVLLALIGLALYRIKKLLDENRAQRTDIEALTTNKAALEKNLKAFHDDCSETHRKRHHVKFAIRAARNNPTPEVMNRLDEYAFDDEAQLEPIEKYQVRIYEND